MSSLTFLCAALAVLSATAAWQPDHILRISEQTIYSDCTPRKSVVVNGTAPGPLLRFKEGEHIWVRVFNDMPDQNTTIHWHGFTQYLSPFSDGTPQASGWPIPPGHFYDYEFQLEKGFYGTYFYHSHVDFQIATASGPIIVDPVGGDPSPVQYDAEIVMLMSDYWHANDSTIVAGLWNETFKWLGEPQALLVNGNAKGNCNASALLPGQKCSTSCGLHQQIVKPNTRYRVRIIGGTSLSYLGMALEGHDMWLFEADERRVGTYITPIKVQALELAAGQRYSVLITTQDKPSKKDFHWRIRTMWRPVKTEGAALWTYSANHSNQSQPYTHQYKAISPPANLNQTVFLPNETFSYADDFVQWSGTEHPPRDDEVTRVIVLNGQQKVSGPIDKGFKWYVNDALNDGSLPSIPYLLQFYQKPEDQRRPNYTAALANGGFDRATNSYPAKLGEVLDIVIQNIAGQTSGVAEAHPWHSHGEKYWDMGHGPGNFSYEALAASNANRTGKPYLRDTSVAYPSPGASYSGQTTTKGGPAGWRLFRIRVEDPGLWLIHCHIAPHQVMGMMTMFLYGAEDLPPIPQTLLQEYLTFGGGAFGAQTYDYWDNNTSTYVPRSYFAEVEGSRKRRKQGSH